MPRAGVFHLFNFLFLLFTMIVGFSNSIIIIIVFRLLSSVFITSTYLNPALTGDIFVEVSIFSRPYHFLIGVFGLVSRMTEVR